MNLEELEGRDDVKGINRAKKERERAHSSVGREREREEGSDCFKDGSARVEREKRKVAAVSRFDSAMFPDSSRGTKGERDWRARETDFYSE